MTGRVQLRNPGKLSENSMMSETTTKATKKSGRGELFDTIIVIIEALVIAVLFRTFLYQPFSIPTASMQQTLMIGDYFVASKFTWGYGAYSFPFPLPFDGPLRDDEDPLDPDDTGDGES